MTTKKEVLEAVRDSELATLRAKAVRGISPETPVYYVFSPMGKQVAEAARKGETIELVKGEDYAGPPPFEMFGILFEKGLAVTDDQAALKRLALEWPDYSIELDGVRVPACACGFWPASEEHTHVRPLDEDDD